MQNGGWDNFEMLVFDVSSSDSNSKIQKLENNIENYGANLNIHVPGRTVKQYYQDNLEKRKMK